MVVKKKITLVIYKYRVNQLNIEYNSKISEVKIWN